MLGRSPTARHRSRPVAGCTVESTARRGHRWVAYEDDETTALGYFAPGALHGPPPPRPAEAVIAPKSSPHQRVANTPDQGLSWRGRKLRERKCLRLAADSSAVHVPPMSHRAGTRPNQI